MAPAKGQRFVQKRRFGCVAALEPPSETVATQNSAFVTDKAKILEEDFFRSQGTRKGEFCGRANCLENCPENLFILKKRRVIRTICFWYSQIALCFTLNSRVK